MQCLTRRKNFFSKILIFFHLIAVIRNPDKSGFLNSLLREAGWKMIPTLQKIFGYLNAKVEIQIEEFCHEKSFLFHRSVKPKATQNLTKSPKTFVSAIDSNKVLLASIGTYDIKSKRVGGHNRFKSAPYEHFLSQRFLSLSWFVKYSGGTLISKFLGPVQIDF